MAQVRSFRRWMRSFLLEDYPGPPVDYVMALAIVFAMMLVTVFPVGWQASLELTHLILVQFVI